MMRYGLELEYFIKNDKDEIIPVPVTHDIPVDDCGYLVECRGEPARNIIDAVFSLKAEMFRVEKCIKRYNYVPYIVPCVKLSKTILRYVRRHYEKGVVRFENYYGYEEHKNRVGEGIAGIHISFTNQETVNTEKYPVTKNIMFDFIKYFVAIDKEFSKEIKEAKRVPGMYELKDDGRIEYRSLPNNINLDDLINRLEKIGIK